jgi:hypothetical protein
LIVAPAIERHGPRRSPHGRNRHTTLPLVQKRAHRSPRPFRTRRCPGGHPGCCTKGAIVTLAILSRHNSRVGTRDRAFSGRHDPIACLWRARIPTTAPSITASEEGAQRDTRENRSPRRVLLQCKTASFRRRSRVAPDARVAGDAAWARIAAVGLQRSILARRLLPCGRAPTRQRPLRWSATTSARQYAPEGLAALSERRGQAPVHRAPPRGDRLAQSRGLAVTAQSLA